MTHFKCSDMSIYKLKCLLQYKAVHMDAAALHGTADAPNAAHTQGTLVSACFCGWPPSACARLAYAAPG
jgi:hypothetical protein